MFLCKNNNTKTQSILCRVSRKGFACKIMRWALHEEIIVRINIFLSQSTKRQNFHIRNAICNHTVYYAQIWRENQRKLLVWLKKRAKKEQKERAKSSDLKDATNQLPLGCNRLQNSNSSPAKKLHIHPQLPQIHLIINGISLYNHTISIVTTDNESNCLSKALKSRTTLRKGLERGRACQRTGPNGFGLLNLYTLFQYNQHIFVPMLRYHLFLTFVIV